MGGDLGGLDGGVDQRAKYLRSLMMAREAAPEAR